MHQRRFLLKNIYYGNELSSLERGTSSLNSWIASVTEKYAFQDVEPTHIVNAVRAFFSRPRKGVFDGPITAGDGAAIMAFMAAVKPAHMVEMGVASGVSSAFIIEAAKTLGLLREKEFFLYSFDIVAERENGEVTGAFLRDGYPFCLDHWKLRTPATSVDILKETVALPPFSAPMLAFIDGGHTHPWPLADIVAMRKLLPPGSWVLMQDVQMMERWIADCVLYGVPSPAPVRGVQLAVNLWPGSKYIGHGICYNMAAIRLDAPYNAFAQFVHAALDFSDEITFKHRDILLSEVNSRQHKPEGAFCERYPTF